MNGSMSVAAVAAVFICCCACGLIKSGGSQTNSVANTTAANTASETELSKKFHEIYEKRAELAMPPKAVQLTTEPYLKGKVVFLSTRKSQPPMVINYSPVVDKYSPPPPPRDTDPLKDSMAVNLNEIGTIVLIEDDLYEDGCKEEDRKLYRGTDGKDYIGSVQVCEVTIIDKTIPAVVFKKKFEGQLKDKELVREDRGYALAKVDRKEIFDFLAGLPRK